MKISLNALKKYVNIKIPTSELLKLIGARLVEIEGTEDLSKKYQGIKVVEVAECEKIEGTHLSLCQISDGEQQIQVVCGAPNVRKGMLTAWIMPGSIVPATFGGENFRLSVKKLRGFESNGMLSATDELGFEGADHSGIIEINPKEAKPGDNFADAFDLNDIILDIENKSLTHRPDCFGIIGFAREIAGILGEKFKEPEFMYQETVFPESFLEYDEKKNLKSKGNAPKISISIKDSSLCPRYSCAVITAKEKFLEKGKFFTKNDVFLYKAGMRPVSPIVDLTNILMLETGQPLHAFDYDKFISVGEKSTPEITVRLAKDGEKLQLLDGKTVDLRETDILITSDNTPVALAGAMGGKNTEIDASTKKIILESATFSLYNLRKTQMAHGIFSEAITRFTKGQPAGQTFNVLAEAVKRLDGEVLAVKDCYPTPVTASTIKIAPAEINSLLGTDYSTDLIKTTLENVGFEVEKAKNSLSVTSPLWRTDIHIKEDIIEEVGRLLGYDNIPLSLPVRPFIEAEIDPIFALKTQLRNILSNKLGAHEILTYSFISEKLLQKVGEDPKNSYKIVNSISPELQCFRQTLTPSLLDKIRENQKAGFSNFSLYEINQVTHKNLGLTQENVPKMETHTALVTLGDYYSAKNILSNLLKILNITGYSIEKVTSHPYFEPQHSAKITLNGQELAILGEIKQSVLKKFKLSSPVSAFEFDLTTILNTPKNTKKSLNISKFPSVSRDITLKASQNIKYSELIQTITETLSSEQLIFHITPTSIYQKDQNSPTKNISFHISLANPKKTLDGTEISAIMEKITNTLSEKYHTETI